MWADLGKPILFFILVAWAILAILAFLSSVMRKGAASEWSQIFRRWTGPRTPHRTERS